MKEEEQGEDREQEKGRKRESEGKQRNGRTLKVRIRSVQECRSDGGGDVM